MSKHEKDNMKVDGINYFSKEQFYKMAKISKRTAKLLLDSNIVPCLHNDKLTKCYKIAKADVDEFLSNREKYLGKLPVGARTSRKRKSRKIYYAQYDFTDEDVALVKDFFTGRFGSYPDMLTVKQITKMLGLSDETIIRKIKKGSFKTIRLGEKFMVSKKSLIEFATSKDFYAINTLSPMFNELLLEIYKLLNKPISQTAIFEEIGSVKITVNSKE